jgi:hypothetical protein
MQGRFNLSKSLNVIQHINRRKDKNHIIISIDAEKVLSQHIFKVIILNLLIIERVHFKILKDQSISSSSGIRQGFTHLLLLLNAVQEVSVRAIKQEKGLKGMQME